MCVSRWIFIVIPELMTIFAKTGVSLLNIDDKKHSAK